MISLSIQKGRAIAAALLVSAATVTAGPLARTQISADAKWVVHLDMERFAPSQTCQILCRDKEGGEGFQTLLARYRNLLGVDPLKDLSHITLYGDQVSGSRGVALIGGALNTKTVVQRLAAYPQYRTRTVGRMLVHKWRDQASGTELNACFLSSRLLAIASDEPTLIGAADVLSGNKSNLASRKTPGLALPVAREGVFLTAVTKSYAGSPEEPLKAMILRNTDSAVLQIAENKGMVDAGVVLTAVSPEAAFQIQQVLNGLIVSANLAADSSSLARLAQLSEVSCQDQTVTLRLHCPARDAAAALAAGVLSR